MVQELTPGTEETALGTDIDPFLDAAENLDDADVASDVPPLEGRREDLPRMDAQEERELLNLLEMGPEDEDRAAPPSMAEPAYSSATPPPPETESRGTDAAAAAFGGAEPEAFEAALERVIRRVFEEKLDAILLQAVETAVAKEIRKLKDALIADTSMDD
jgi:hypothetical protein